MVKTTTTAQTKKGGMMKTIEFDINSNPISLIANKILGCRKAQGDKDRTVILMCRLTDGVDEDFIVNEPYRQVLMKIINTEE